MKKRIYINKRRKNRDWSDEECKCARLNVRRCLRKFRKTLKVTDSIAYFKARREYKALLYKKEKDFKDATMNKMIQSVNDQKLLQDTMHKVQKGKRQPSNNITSDYWFNHFGTVLEKEIDTGEEDTFQDGEESFLNRHIPKEEVLPAGLDVVLNLPNV